MMCRSVGHELEIVWLVLVVTRDVEGHHSLEENLRRRVVTEECVPRDIIELALRRVGAALDRPLGDYRGIQAEETVQPSLDLIAN